jgi:hypothetical protein
MKTSRFSVTSINCCQTIQLKIPDENYFWNQRLQNVNVSENQEIFEDKR